MAHFARENKLFQSKAQSCWGLIDAGWVIAYKDKGCVCKLSPEGRDIATGKIQAKIINR